MFYEYFKPFTEKYDINHSQWKSELAKHQPKDFYSKYCIKLANRCKKSKQRADQEMLLEMEAKKQLETDFLNLKILKEFQKEDSYFAAQQKNHHKMGFKN